MDVIDRVASAFAETTGAGKAAGGLTSRRSLLRKAAAGVAALSGGLGFARSASASSYYTYVVSDGAHCRYGASTDSPIKGNIGCGTRIYGSEYIGVSASSCNEFNSNVWFWIPASGCYVHRGTLNPYGGGECECW